jgi:hypothetical protein
MAQPRICVAGIEMESRTHVRPLSAPDEPLTRSLLAQNGGPLRIGARVELGDVEPQPDPPETEDHSVSLARMESQGVLDPDEYLELIDQVSYRSLRSAFGIQLKRHGRSYAVDVGGGTCSLACVRPRKQLNLEVDSYGKARLAFYDTPEPALISIADLRFYEDDHRTIHHEVFPDVHRRILQGVGVWVMFGLARAWKADNDDTERHWLQVNGLCLEDSPLGETL